MTGLRFRLWNSNMSHPSTELSKAGRNAANGAALHPSSRFGLRHLFMVFAICICVIGLATIGSRSRKQLDEIQRVRRAMESSMSILASTIKWNEKYGRPWPPGEPTDQDGTPINSWRFQLYPTFAVPDENYPYPHDLNAPWDSRANRTVVADSQMPYCFANRPRRTETHIFGIRGPDTAFDDSVVSRFSELPPHLIVMMEVAGSRTHWMAPGDYQVADLLAATGKLGDTAKSHLPDRVHLLFADGEVWALRAETPIDLVKPFLTITGARETSRETLLKPYRLYKSRPG